MPKAISMFQFSLPSTTCMEFSYFQKIMVIYLHRTFKVIRTSVQFSKAHVLVMLLVTISMEHSPSWEADSRSAGKRISRPLQNPDAHCLIHKSPPQDRNLNQTNSVHTLIPYSFKIHFNIIAPTNRPPKRILLFRFPDEIVYVFLTMCAI
jgi:hypothetical protein